MATLLGFSIYGTEADCIAYIGASVGPGPDAWNASSDTTRKQRAIVTAKRLIDAATWQGEPAVDGQADAWPRTGVVDRYGNAVADDEVPDDVVNAEYELAAIVFADSSAAAAATSGSNVKRVKAGPVEVENFRPTDVTGTKFPAAVQKLLGQYLASSTAGSQNAAYNTRSGSFDGCVRSSFDDCAEYDLDGPIG